jgi:hypothetical protein
MLLGGGIATCEKRGCVRERPGGQMLLGGEIAYEDDVFLDAGKLMITAVVMGKELSYTEPADEPVRMYS